MVAGRDQECGGGARGAASSCAGSPPPRKRRRRWCWCGSARRGGGGRRSGARPSKQSVCKPVCSGVRADALPPARKNIRSGVCSPPVAAPAVSMPAGEWENWRCIFVGMPLSDDVLMRRFVLEEYAEHRRMQMQEAAKRSGRCWFPPGPSRLCEMSLAA